MCLGASIGFIMLSAFLTACHAVNSLEPLCLWSVFVYRAVFQIWRGPESLKGSGVTPATQACVARNQNIECALYAVTPPRGIVALVQWWAYSLELLTLTLLREGDSHACCSSNGEGHEDLVLWLNISVDPGVSWGEAAASQPPSVVLISSFVWHVNRWGMNSTNEEDLSRYS